MGTQEYLCDHDAYLRALRRLSGQHIDHQIFLKFLDMLFLAINYHKTPEKNPI